MVYITTHNLKASEKGDMHTYILVRIVMETENDFSIFSFDIGKNFPTPKNVLDCLCDSDCYGIINKIINDKCFYIDNQKIVVIHEELPEFYFFHGGIKYIATRA